MRMVTPAATNARAALATIVVDPEVVEPEPAEAETVAAGAASAVACTPPRTGPLSVS